MENAKKDETSTARRVQYGKTAALYRAHQSYYTERRIETRGPILNR